MRSWRVINVGSIGFPFDANPGKAEYGIFTFEDGDVQVDLRAIPYDVEAVIADSRGARQPGDRMAGEKLRGQR